MRRGRPGISETKQHDRKAHEAPGVTVYGAEKDLKAGGSEPQPEQIREGIALGFQPLTDEGILVSSEPSYSRRMLWLGLALAQRLPGAPGPDGILEWMKADQALDGLVAHAVEVLKKEPAMSRRHLQIPVHDTVRMSEACRIHREEVR